jgi:hypothetical protein
MLWIAGVHLLGLACVAILLLPALRDNPVVPTQGTDGESDDGWGRGPKLPPPTPPAPPRGGIPLPDAVPSLVRLREPGRLSERLPSRDRRPTREPSRRPVRAPSRGYAASPRSSWGNRGCSGSGR